MLRQEGILHRGEDRLIASRKLANQPVVINATTTVTEALGNWRMEAGYLIGAVSVIELVVLWWGC